MICSLDLRVLGVELGKWSNRKRKNEAWFLWNLDVIRMFCYTGALSVAGNRKL